ncbi:MAG: metallophosphoesterase family protein [Kiritimatiellaeota bacterium]|nr:metallophosphoesterase family protein [Kiritimatiellota bacterium]
MSTTLTYAILGDIHSNLEALQAVLADAKAQGANRYACVGDIVGYNANPGECLEIVRGLKCVIVRGNHDHYCSMDEALNGFHPMAADAVDWTRKQLSAEQRLFLSNLPYVAPVETFTMVHSTLDMPGNWGYVFEALEAEASFAYQRSAVCFFGHTHVPLAFEKFDAVRGGLYSKIRIQLGRKYFVNVGSVGQPRDGDPRAAYVLFDLMRNAIELRRVAYDIPAVQEKIKLAGLPARMAARLAVGR